MTTALHRVREVRQREGVSLRTFCRRLNITAKMAKMLDDPQIDMRLSDLHLVAKALEVPVYELLGEQVTSAEQQARETLVRIIPALNRIAEGVSRRESRSLACFAQERIRAVLPDCESLTPMHAVGERRTRDDLGRVAAQPIHVADWIDGAEEESLFKEPNW